MTDEQLDEWRREHAIYDDDLDLWPMEYFKERICEAHWSWLVGVIAGMAIWPLAFWLIFLGLGV